MKSIRTKLIFWICVLFVFIGALIYVPLSTRLPRMIAAQILKRDVEIAGYLSNEAKEPLLTNNKVELSLLLNDNLDKLEDARYLFIQGPDGSVISHTFTDGFPKGLLSLGYDEKPPYRIKEFLSSGTKMYDIAIPILKGELGALHLGVSLEAGKKDIAEIAKINTYVAAVILAGLGAGVLVFLIIGFLFSNQIIRLKDFASRIGEGDLEAKVDVTSRDEIGALAVAFNEMALRLKQKIREIKRLNKTEERNKVAFDLHDGCAQHAANIIKRIELSEKLFRIDPEKAFRELEELKESTKDTLNWTRQMIFDLKSPAETDFKLQSRLSDYVADYMKRNDISVRLDASGAINDIQADKARSVFYIITEALANARKHGKAKHVELHLSAQADKGLAIHIKDDGSGFDVYKAGSLSATQGKWGLISMRERSESLRGTFRITSEPGRGAQVSIHIPLTPAAA